MHKSVKKSLPLWNLLVLERGTVCSYPSVARAGAGSGRWSTTLSSHQPTGVTTTLLFVPALASFEERSSSTRTPPTTMTECQNVMPSVQKFLLETIYGATGRRFHLIPLSGALIQWLGCTSVPLSTTGALFPHAVALLPLLLALTCDTAAQRILWHVRIFVSALIRILCFHYTFIHKQAFLSCNTHLSLLHRLRVTTNFLLRRRSSASHMQGRAYTLVLMGWVQRLVYKSQQD